MTTKIKKIFITGVSGFIGSKLAKRCVEEGYEVIGITRTKNSEISNKLNIDLINFNVLSDSNIKFGNADTLIHCATANDIISKDINAGFSLSINGTSNLFENIKKSKISNFIFFSTAQVYGTELKGVINENSKIDCKNAYGLNHYLGEELCKFYANNYNFNVTVLRPSNVYGAPELNTVNRKTLVPMCFVEEVMQNGSITLRSSGKQCRNFISTDELANIVLNILKNFQTGFAIRNCGSVWNTTIIDIAQIVAKCYKKISKKEAIIKIENDNPKQSNIFEYKSNYLKNQYTVDECKKKMEYMILKLFNQY